MQCHLSPLLIMNNVLKLENMEYLLLLQSQSNKQHLEIKWKSILPINRIQTQQKRKAKNRELEMSEMMPKGLNLDIVRQIWHCKCSKVSLEVYILKEITRLYCHFTSLILHEGNLLELFNNLGSFPDTMNSWPFMDIWNRWSLLISRQRIPFQSWFITWINRS